MRKLNKSERQVLLELEKAYRSALSEVQEKIKALQADEQTQSKIYQLKYQQNLERQLTEILNNLKYGSYDTVQEYLDKCYTDTFAGTMYNISGYGIPMSLPIDQKKMVKATGKTGDDFKLSKKMYSNVDELKKTVQHEISRGIAAGLSYSDIARNISSIGETNLHNAQRIARTEGHRVQEESRYDAMQEAKANGADIVKVWDATLDSHTRPEHRMLDGQVREIDEDFTVDGYSGKGPGMFGDAYMDINCRCCCNEMPRWSLSGTVTKMDNETKELVTGTYEEFRRKYY